MCPNLYFLTTLSKGIDMIPYQEAITQNLLSDFVLTSENLTLSEWSQLTSDIFHNFSIVRFDISGQQNLEVELWRNLFEGLATNNLTTLRLQDCFVFHPHNLISHKSPKQKLSFIDLPNLYPLRASFQAMLLNVPSLVVVDLSGNCLHSVFRELIKPLSKLKKLKELYLSKNKLRDSEANEKDYNQLFRGCISLVVLDLSDNFLDDDSVAVISAAMRQCKTKRQLANLKCINLDGNEISMEGATELLSIVESFRKLSINLQQNAIDEALFNDMQTQAAVQLLINDSDTD